MLNAVSLYLITCSLTAVRADVIFFERMVVEKWLEFDMLSWVYWCLTSHATIFQSYMWRHRCAGGLKKKLYLRSGSQRHRHFTGFFNVPVLHRHGTILLIRWFRHTAPFSRLLRYAGDTEDVLSTLTPGVLTGVEFDMKRDLKALATNKMYAVHIYQFWHLFSWEYQYDEKEVFFRQLSRYVCTRRIQFPLQYIHVVSFSDNDGVICCFFSRRKFTM